MRSFPGWMAERLCAALKKAGNAGLFSFHYSWIPVIPDSTFVPLLRVR
jgi:hypothetical protein